MFALSFSQGRNQNAAVSDDDRQVSMEEAMELMETEENYIILDVRRREDVQQSKDCIN